MITLVRTVDPAFEPVTLAQAKSQLNVDPTLTDDDAYISILIQAAREYCENYTSRAYVPQTWRYSLDAFPWYGANINWTDRFSVYQRAALWTQSLTITIPRPPLISISSIIYLDVNGVPQTIDPAQYVVDYDSEPARVVPAPGLYWPYPQLYRPNTVQITFQAGYKQIVTESHTVPASTPYTVTLNQSSPLAILNVTNTTTETDVEDYTISGNVLTFGSDDASASISVEYDVAGSIPARLQQAILLLVGHWYQNRETVTEAFLKPAPMATSALLDSLRIDLWGFGVD